MFDAPADTWYLWLGVAVTSTVALGGALAVPSTAPPDPTGAATTLDSVAASTHDATGQHPLSATRIKLGPHRLALENAGGTAHAEIAYGPVTPVRDGTNLSQVLTGTPPATAFESPDQFRAAAATARNQSAEWSAVDGHLLVRHVTWRGVDVTLVGA